MRPRKLLTNLGELRLGLFQAGTEGLDLRGHGVDLIRRSRKVGLSVLLQIRHLGFHLADIVSRLLKQSVKDRSLRADRIL